MITPNGQDESKKEAQPAEENDAKERKTNKKNKDTSSNGSRMIFPFGI